MEQTLYTQLLAAQLKFPKIKKDATNPFFKNKYASLDGILETVLPILHKNALVLIQNPINDGDRVGVHTQIFCATTPDGTCVESKFTVTLAKNDPQGAGSAITYCRRYALTSMLGLNVEEDDDGNTASATPRPTNQVQSSPTLTTGSTQVGIASPTIRR